MPGIVGLITSMPRENAERELARMVNSLRHESFYVTGTWVDESLGIYVGWTARKNSFAHDLPHRNEDGKLVLVFSGEEFSDPRAITSLRASGHDFEPGGSGYLVHLAEQEQSFLDGLNGRFHGLLADRRTGVATLFNDRYGMHRLYYHSSKDAFYFAAEAKGILAVCPELRRLDPEALGEFISCGVVMENRTLFNGIQVLPPGSRWLFRDKLIDSKTNYFSPSEWENQSTLGDQAYSRELENTIRQNLPRYFSGDEPIAMSLTGGLDTRIIMAWQRALPGSLPCYTFGSMYRDCGDVLLSRKIASVCRQSHQTIQAGAEFLSQFPHYAERAIYLTDGCVDVSRSPDLYLNEKAREIAPVRMTGNLGGEVLRSVRTFRPAAASPELFNPEILPYVTKAETTYENATRGNPLSFAVFKQSPWSHYGILALEQTQLSLRTPFLDNDFVRAVFRAPASSFASNEPSLRLISEGNPGLLKIPTDRGVAGEKGKLLGAVNRALLEFLFKAEYAYDMGMPQSVARVDHALSALHLERLFLGRHKVFHFRIWYRSAIRNYVRELLLDQRTLTRPYIRRRKVEQIVEGHLSGKRNYTNEIHKVMTLELIHRLFIDHSAASLSSQDSDLVNSQNRC
jgi:asparagine synthase (glutamine-hydrolysing)